MTTMLRRLLAVFMLTAAAWCASGCGALGFTLNPQELYRLPYLPAKYTELNNQLNAILDTGAEYAAPSSGTNIQPVQLTDLDGDGWQEAVAFFRNTSDEKPLKIYIFTAKDDTYEQTAVIEGSGTGIYSIAYQDMNGDGRTELAVGWRVNTDLLALTIYALHPGGPEELVRTDYVRYAITDLTGNGMGELVAFRSNEDGDGVADFYNWQEGNLTFQSSTRISATMAELSQQGRVTVGTLADQVPALFVTTVSPDAQAATDILTVKNGELNNIAVSSLTGVSAEISSFVSLYPTDIDGDGITEVPRPVSLPNAAGTEAVYQRVDWQQYGSGGGASLAMSTYHNTEDGWYLCLPEAWRSQIAVSRSTGQDESSVTFYFPGQTEPTPVLRITAITGTNRENRAVRGSRFTLSRQEGTFYVAELLDANETAGITEDQVRASFGLIAKEWTFGEN